MRVILPLMTLIILICCSKSNETTDNPNATKTARIVLDTEETDSTLFKATVERKRKLRRLNQEIRSRAILNSLGDHIGKMDADYLDQKFGVKTFPEFDGMPDLDLQIQIQDLEKESGSAAITYDNNDLKDIFILPAMDVDRLVPNVRDDGVIKTSQSVVAIIHKEYLKLQPDGTYDLITQPLLVIGGDFLCSFSDFYYAAYTKVAGTGFLVADTLIATAGHVYDNEPNIIEDYYFVFDYKMLTPWKVRTKFPGDDVYKAKKVVKRMNMNGNDYALILLQRAVVGRDPLDYRSSGKVDKEAKLYLLGHPFGLPMKYSGIGKVLNNIACHFFTCNISNYEYNSGSPVFDRSSHLVEGILCRDIGPDEETLCNCVAPAIFKTQYGIPGVEITRSFMFASCLERPNSVLIRCRVLSAIVRIENAEEIPFNAGDEILLPYSDIFDMELLINAEADCWVPFKPDEGDIWEIQTSTEDNIMIVKVCE